MITMFGNDICYAIGELHQLMATAFASPPEASTILQWNGEGFPCEIILAAMSFFSDAGNAGKAKMYGNSHPEFQCDFVLHELHQAGVNVDQMLEAAGVVEVES